MSEDKNNVNGSMQPNPNTPPQNPVDEHNTWVWRKQTHVDLLTEDEIQRVLKEKQEHRLQQEKEGLEKRRLEKLRDEKFYHDLHMDCTMGSPEERFAKAMIRATQRGIFSPQTFTKPEERVQILVDYLRLHNIMIRDGKEKLTVEDYRKAVMVKQLFQMDKFVHRQDVRLNQSTNDQDNNTNTQ